MDMDFGLLLWGLLASVVLTGGVTAWRTIGTARARKKILAVPESALADAAEGAVVVVRGRAASADGETVSGQVTKRKALWSRLTVRGETHGTGMMTWRNLGQEVAAKDFFIEDTKGTRARVLVTAAGADVAVQEPHVVFFGEEQVISPEMRELLLARDDLKEVVGPKQEALCALRIFEETIASGDDVYVLGQVSKKDGQVVLGPSSMGLIVALRDIRDLARSGALWESRPSG